MQRGRHPLALEEHLLRGRAAAGQGLANHGCGPHSIFHVDGGRDDLRPGRPVRLSARLLLPKETRGDAVNASIRLNFGDERSLAGQSRSASLTSQMLMRGTASKTRQQLQDELDKLKTQLNVGGGGGQVGATLVSTRTNLAAALKFAIEVLRKPSFPESELETLRAGTLADLDSAQSDPQAIVSRAFARHGNPYGAHRHPLRADHRGRTSVAYLRHRQEPARLPRRVLRRVERRGRRCRRFRSRGDSQADRDRARRLEEPEAVCRGAHAVP